MLADSEPRAPGLLTQLLRQTVALDRSQLRGGSAALAAVGVVVPLAVGLAVHHEIDGAVAVIGTLSVGFASMRGSNRGRVLAALAATVGMGVSTTVGALAGSHPWVSVPVTMLWAFGAGLVVALGQTALVIGLQSVVALLVVGTFPATVGQAVQRGGFVLAGGLVQVALLLVTLPWRRYQRERAALGAAFGGLAAYAATVADGGTGPPDPGLLVDTGDVLADPQLLGERHEVAAYVQLADEATRVRLALLGLARATERLPEDSALIRSLCADAAELLGQLATAVRAGRPLEPAPAVWGRAHEAVGRLSRPGPFHPLRDDAAQRAHALLGQLRSCRRLLAAAQGDDEVTLVGAPPARRARRWRTLVPLAEAPRMLRAHLSADSPILRHAIRLSVVLGLAATLYRVLPIPHGYWLPLTALVVLRPDYVSTLSRGMSRILGTLVGAAVATLLASLLRPGPVELAVLVGVFSFLCYALIAASYAAFTVCVTSLVVFLLATTALPELTAVGDRALDTVLGGALALGAYLLWPTWQSRSVSDDLAALLGRQAEYLQAVLAAYVDPGAADRDRIRDRRRRAQRARSDMEAALDRLRSEPQRPGPLPGQLLDRVMGADRALVTAALGLQAHHQSLTSTGTPQLAPLARALVAALEELATAVAERRPPAEPADLRALQVELADQVLRPRVRAEGPLAVDAAVLLAETDLIVDRVNSMAELLGGTRPPPVRRWAGRTLSPERSPGRPAAR